MAFGRKRSSFKIRRLLERPFRQRLFFTALLIASNIKPTKISAQTAQPTPNFSNGSHLCRVFNESNVESDKTASDNANIFLSYNTGKLISFNLHSGLNDWESEIGGTIEMKPLVSKDSVYIFSRISAENVTSAYYILRRLDKKSGLTVWQTKIINPEKTSDTKSEGKNNNLNDVPNEQDKKDIKIDLTLKNENLIVTDSSGAVFLLNSTDGTIKATRSLNEHILSIADSDAEQILYGTADGQIIGLSFEDLSEVYRQKIKGIPTALLKTGKKVFWGSRRGVVAELPDNWQFRAGGEILSINQTLFNSLIISSADNYIYSIALNNGKLLWKKRLGGRPAFPPSIAEGFALITTVGEPDALFIELPDGKTANKISLSDNLYYTAQPFFTNSDVIFPNSSGVAYFSFLPERQICSEISITDKK